MKTFLFQGDSITDAGRRRDEYGKDSYGYPTFVEGILGAKYPNARIKEDAINYKPDVLTVLIGVNDVWHELGGRRNGIDADLYFTYYEMFVTQVMKMCPKTKIFILEPFVLKASATEKDWNIFKNEVHLRAVKAKELAEKYSLPFIPLQETFDGLPETAPADHWLKDGVHPAPAGHYVIAEKIVAAVEKNCPELLK